MFRNREDTARQLAKLLRPRRWHDPLVLAVPRGGVVVGAVLAQELGAELDVVLSRKLRAPDQQEAALGALGEDGSVYLNPDIGEWANKWAGYIEEERARQVTEIERRTQLIRKVRPRASIVGRSVIVTDDGIATGSTMIAALQWTRTHDPSELIVAVPVASPDRLAKVSEYCDKVFALLTPKDFWAVGQYYEEFEQVEDEQVIDLLTKVKQT